MKRLRSRDPAHDADRSAASQKKARRDVGLVFELWKRVRNKETAEPITPASLAVYLQDVAPGHVAAQCALAAIIPRIFKKVPLSPQIQLESVSAILAALPNVPAAVRLPALESVLPLARGLLSQKALENADAVRDHFKALALSLLVLCSEGAQFSDELVQLARTAFECRPYWFIIALTDALEDVNHPALKGAVTFGKRCLLSRDSGKTLFMEVMSADSEAASSASMLLYSCISEVHGKPQLVESLKVMLELNRLLDSSTDSARPPREVTPTCTPAMSLPPASHGRLPGGTSRFPSSGMLPLHSSELPGPPPRLDSSRSKGNASGQLPPAPALSPKDDSGPLPPPPKRHSTPNSRSMSPARSDGGRNTSPAGTAAIWRSQPALTAATAEQMLGERNHLDWRVASVAPSLCVVGLPARVSNRELCRALPSHRKLAHVEVTQSCAILQFSCMQAAVRGFSSLGRNMGCAGWRYTLAGFATASFAAASALPESWVFVSCPPKPDSLEGIMHVLCHGGVPAPSKYHLLDQAPPHSCQGCLLMFERSQDAEACVSCLHQWQDDIPRMQQIAASGPEEPPEGSKGSRGSRDSAMSPDGWQSEPDNSGPLWRGFVAKSGVRQCAVRITSASAVMRRECNLWQDTLDVQHRTTIPQAVQVWQEHAQEHRGWAWLHADGDDTAPFGTFLQYLTARDRAGIVRPAPQGQVIHTVYLIPASPEICSSVEVGWDQASGLLLLMIVNQAPPEA